MNFIRDTVSAEGMSMEYIKFGTGDKALVILPGLSVQSVLLYSQSIVNHYKLFTKDFTVYVFDRRTKLPPVYSVRDMAYDTLAAIRKLGLDTISLFGASQGGMMAMALTAAAGELVSRLVLASTAVRADEESLAVIEEWISFAAKKDSRGLYLSMGEKIYPHDFFQHNRAVFSQLAQSVTNEEMERFVILASSIRDCDMREDVAGISCPVFIARDDSDKVFGDSAGAEMADCFSGRAETKIYKGFGHAMYDTAPDYMDMVYGFLTK